MIDISGKGPFNRPEDPMIFNVTGSDVVIARNLTKLELRMLRDYHKLTQSELAKMSGLSVQTVSNLESVKSDSSPTMDSLIKYIDALGYEIFLRPKTLPFK